MAIRPCTEKMNKIISAAIIVFGTFSYVGGNPLTPTDIVYISAFPPEIGIVFRDSISLAGDTIYAISGSAVILNHEIPGHEDTVIFDSSNTSGFIIDSEADTIRISSLWYLNTVRLGTFRWSPAPIKGHPVRLIWVNPEHYMGGWWDWSYDFTDTDWSWTNIVINEINANCDWRAESNFIELYNQSDSAIDIGGWMVVCDTICVIPQNAIIDGNGFYVIDQCDFPGIFDMDFEADNIYLVRADSVLVDQVGWSSDHGTNVSFMRYPDGDVDTMNFRQGYMGYDDVSSYTFEDGFPSRCAPNRHSSPGFVVIGAHARNESGNVDVWWTDPIWEPIFDYSVVVRSFTHYPQDINDGDIVYQGTEQHVIDMTPPGHMEAYYTIFARDLSGNYSTPTDESRIFVILQTAGVNEEPILPENICSFVCYPNPFNSRTTIRLVLSENSQVSLNIYNITGQKVATLYEGIKQAGEHKILWDGTGFPSGIYFVNLQQKGGSESIKLLLVR